MPGAERRQAGQLRRPDQHRARRDRRRRGHRTRGRRLRRRARRARPAGRPRLLDGNGPSGPRPRRAGCAARVLVRMAHHPRRTGRLLVEAQGARQGRRRSRTPRPLRRPRRPGRGLPAHLRQRHPLDGRPRQRPRRRREPGPARVESPRGRSHPRQQHHAPRGLRAVHGGRTRQRRARAQGARDRQPSERLGARARSGMRPEHYDVVVIGGGQPGLAIGYHLAQQGRRFTILEAAGEPASAWRGRWDSLRLFTSGRYDSLPGLDFPGDPDSYPGRGDVIAYLTDYAQRFELPVEFDSRVQGVRPRDGGGFLVELADRTYEADQGVVGGGNTAYQISEELAHSREVHLAIGARQMPLPQRILGRDLFRYLQATGLMYKTVDSRLARRMKDKETLIGSSPRGARKLSIQLRPRATAAQGRSVTFADGSELAVDVAVWATGFRLDHSFVQLPVFDELGAVTHRRGVTDVPGVYFLGLLWQHTRGSALLGWVKDDAQFIAQRIDAFAQNHATASALLASEADSR